MLSEFRSSLVKFLVLFEMKCGECIRGLRPPLPISHFLRFIDVSKTSFLLFPSDEIETFSIKCGSATWSYLNFELNWRPGARGLSVLCHFCGLNSICEWRVDTRPISEPTYIKKLNFRASRWSKLDRDDLRPPNVSRAAVKVPERRHLYHS